MTEANELPGPMEFLDLEHGSSVQLRVDRMEMGTALIHPSVITPRQIRLYMQQNGLTAPPAPGTPITVRIPVLRLHGVRVDTPSPLHYWDVSSLTLQANIWPRMKQFENVGLTLTITANGYRPSKRYSVEQA